MINQRGLSPPPLPRGGHLLDDVIPRQLQPTHPADPAYQSLVHIYPSRVQSFCKPACFISEQMIWSRGDANSGVYKHLQFFYIKISVSNIHVLTENAGSTFHFKPSLGQTE